MRKQTTTDFTSNNANQNQFKESNKNVATKENPRYIYTEEDLGEGILDVGISSYYLTEQQKNLNTKPWTTMLKTQWA